MSDYAHFDATGLAAAVTQGELSPRDVLDAALDVVAQRNPELGAVVELCADAAAEQIDRGLPAGPLHGVPILLKDLGCPAVGTHVTYGSELMRGAEACDHDSLYVARLRAAGAIILGRTLSGEFGVTLLSEPAAFPPARNPYDLDCTPGGSSGGSAVAVASGMTPLAHATDGCGSIRVPASHCGLVGLKPGRGRVSFAPDAGESWAGMSTMGGLARTVRDAAMLLEVVAGAEKGDPYGARTDRSRLPRRIGLAVEGFGHEAAPACLAAVEKAAELLRDLGCEVVPLGLPLDLGETVERLIPIWAAQLWSLVEPRYAALGRAPDGWGMEPLSWALAQMGPRLSAVDHLASIRFLHRTGREHAAALGDVDAVLTPVAATPPHRLGAVSTDGTEVAAFLYQLFGLYPFTVGCNVTGWPAIALPLARTREDLPVGVQLAAPQGSEAMLLALAAQMDAAGGFE